MMMKYILFVGMVLYSIYAVDNWLCQLLEIFVWTFTDQLGLVL